MLFTPQPKRILATEQPKVPAPNKRHLRLQIFSRSRLGTRRHFISFRFKLIALSDSLIENKNINEVIDTFLIFVFKLFLNNYLVGSIVSDKSAIVGPNLSFELLSQPTR